MAEYMIDKVDMEKEDSHLESVEVHHSKGSDMVSTKKVREVKEFIEKYLSEKGSIEFEELWMVFKNRFGRKNVTNFTVAFKELMDGGKVLKSKGPNGKVTLLV